MPVIDINRFKELSNDPKFLDDLNSNINIFLNTIPKTDENGERLERLKDYMSAIQELSDPEASDETIRRSLNKLDGFKAFLEEKDIKDESNFDKLKKDIPSHIFDNVLIYIEKASKALGLEIGYKLKTVVPKTEVKEDRYTNVVELISADKYIEKIRDHEFKEFNPNRLNEVELDKFTDRILHIMAARQLANSDRGKVAKLKATILDPAEIDERVEEMKEDPAFASFLAKIKYDPDSYKKAFLAGQATPGHGGKLDDMFKEHMLNLPPGLMPNSKLHERYLPTAKARIESIQKQVENKEKFNRELHRAEASLESAEDNTPKKRYYEWLRSSLEEYTESLKYMDRPVCEVVAIRNLVHADYGKKESLEKKIPSFEEDTLRSDSARITDTSNEHAYVSTNTEHLKGLLLKGHGGEMAEMFRSHIYVHLNENERIPGMKDFSMANSILTREEELNKKAKTLSEDIKKEEDAEKKKELVDEGKVLLVEYLILCAKSTNPKTGQVSFSLQFRDCPWGKINELHEKGLEYDDESLKGIKKFNDKDVTYLLDKMGRVGMELVVGSIKDKMIEVSYRKPKPEPKVENNGPKISG